MEIDKWLNNLLDSHEIPEGIEIERRFNANKSYSFDRVYFGQALKHIITNAVQALQEESSKGKTICIEMKLSPKPWSVWKHRRFTQKPTRRSFRLLSNSMTITKRLI